MIRPWTLENFEGWQSHLGVWRWDRVANVCRTWRSVVLSSPRRLKLFLHCTYGKPVVDILNHWPHFPIFIKYGRNAGGGLTPEDEDNIIYALQHPSRIFGCVPCNAFARCQISCRTMGRRPFGRLDSLDLFCPEGGPEITLPKGFLDTSAPRLSWVFLEGAVVPSLPKVLASTGVIWNLRIGRIPDAGCFSPAALFPHISVMSHLRTLYIHYLPSASHLQAAGRARSPPSLTTVVLPALVELKFQGASEDLEDLVSRFVAPHLESVTIHLHNQLIIDLTHLGLLLSRCNTVAPRQDVRLNIGGGGIKSTPPDVGPPVDRPFGGCGM
ncbi:hypothetical protein BC834DRAFT_58901 [Gloeopeniophorella convolvens]|nr:hypothetical protein BC834DRAFT_58901 [Gloeopeniophorella convolvens]